MARPVEYDFDLALERGMKLFWKFGYSNTSLNLLESHLGMPRVSLYNRYGGKEAFFQACLRKYSADALQQLETFLNNQIQNGLVHWFLWMTAKSENQSLPDIELEDDALIDKGFSWGCLMANTSIEAGLNSGILSDESLALVQDYRQALLDRFQRYVELELEVSKLNATDLSNEDPHKDSTPEELAECYLTFLWGILVSIRLYGTPETLRPAVEGFIQMKMAALKA